MTSQPIRYAWTATGMKPSETEFGPTRYINEHEHDRIVGAETEIYMNAVASLRDHLCIPFGAEHGRSWDEAVKESIAAMRRERDDAEQRYQEAQADIEALRAVLWYAKHGPSCPMWGATGNEVCNCGLEEKLLLVDKRECRS